MKKSSERQARYDAEHTRRFGLKLNTETDADIIQYLEGQTSIQGAIKDAIRKTMKGANHMKRVYGMTNTHLTLTDKARKYYSGADPLKIIEYDDGSGEYRYTIKAFGDPETRLMTAAEVNKWLEDSQDEVDELDAEDEEDED